VESTSRASLPRLGRDPHPVPAGEPPGRVQEHRLERLAPTRGNSALSDPSCRSSPSRVRPAATRAVSRTAPSALWGATIGKAGGHGHAPDLKPACGEGQRRGAASGSHARLLAQGDHARAPVRPSRREVLRRPHLHAVDLPPLGRLDHEVVESHPRPSGSSIRTVWRSASPRARAPGSRRSGCPRPSDRRSRPSRRSSRGCRTSPGSWARRAQAPATSRATKSESWSAMTASMAAGPPPPAPWRRGARATGQGQGRSASGGPPPRGMSLA
jgi:hypothetical protein